MKNFRKEKFPKSVFQFYLLVIYVIFQFSWWAYLISSLNLEVYELKESILLNEHVSNPSLYQIQFEELEKRKKARWLMIAGEGTVFILVLTLGIIQTRRSIKKEIELTGARNNFILSVTHELKTPLAAIRLQTETMLKHQLTAEQTKKMLETTRDESQRLEKLTEAILMAARLDTHTYVPHKENINLSEWIIQFVNKYTQGKSIQHNIVTNIQNNVNLFTDKSALESILLNLLENAIKYSARNPIIEAGLMEDTKEIKLWVKDNGIGITAEEQLKIFDMFYRVGSEDTRNAKGTGLGLYIVKNLCKILGAKINVKSVVPQGTVFEVTFAKNS